MYKDEELPSLTTAIAISRRDLSTLSHTHFLFCGSHSSIASGDSDRVIRDSRLIAVKKFGFASSRNYCCNKSCVAAQ